MLQFIAQCGGIFRQGKKKNNNKFDGSCKCLSLPGSLAGFPWQICAKKLSDILENTITKRLHFHQPGTRLFLLSPYVIPRSMATDALKFGRFIPTICAPCHRPVTAFAEVSLLHQTPPCESFPWLRARYLPWLLEAPLPHFCLEGSVYGCISLQFLI